MNESQVHVEREKTKRTLIVASAITLVGLVCAVMFFNNIDNRGGTLKVTKDGVEVSLEKPLVEQIGADTARLKVLGDSISVSSGTVSDIEIEGGLDSGGFVGKRFNGKNLIDTAAGFLLASDSPDRWQVQTPSEGTDVVGKLTSADGSVIEIRAVPLKGLQSLDDFVRQQLDSLKTIDVKANAVKRDSTTWMVWHTNPVSKEVVCTKIVDANGLRYFAYSSIKNPAAKLTVRESVAGFSVIEKPALARKVGIETKRLQR
ncbi:MAG: hypothetical protein SGJ05_07720 [bacterium]|nr:hypothetical protein [bacterium]